MVMGVVPIVITSVRMKKFVSISTSWLNKKYSTPSHY